MASTASRARQVREIVASQKMITIVRTESADLALKAAQAVFESGLRLIDIPVTVPSAYSVIEKLAEREDIVQGAGSVTTMTEAADAISAGCSFIVCPYINRTIIDYCRDNKIFVAAGGLTPTEVMEAYLAGVDLVAVYPVHLMGGVTYTQHLLTPMPFLPLMPVGGMTTETAGQHLAAGAKAIGVVDGIVDQAALQQGDFQAITAKARAFVAAVCKADEECHASD